MTEQVRRSKAQRVMVAAVRERMSKELNSELTGEEVNGQMRGLAEWY